MTRISLTSTATATAFAWLGLLTSLAPAAGAWAPDDEPWLHPYAGPSRSDVEWTRRRSTARCFAATREGKPVVLLWGLGFKDRPWSPAQDAELVEFFKNDSNYGGVYLIGGVDPLWRPLRGESRPDEGWSKVYRSFDAISPWDAGRYRGEASMDRIRKQVWEGDLAELRASGKGYMPTAFPGFSWDNLPGCRRDGR